MSDGPTGRAAQRLEGAPLCQLHEDILQQGYGSFERLENTVVCQFTSLRLAAGEKGFGESVERRKPDNDYTFQTGTLFSGQINRESV